MISNVGQPQCNCVAANSSEAPKKVTAKYAKIGAISGVGISAAMAGINMIRAKGTPAGALLGACAKAMPGKFVCTLGIQLAKYGAIAAAVGAGIGKIVDVVRSKKAQKEETKTFQA